MEGRVGAAQFRGTSRFELIRRLGSGGAGEVYEAFDREQGARIALKVLHSMRADSLLRFKNEFRSMQDLRHPNLVGLGELIETEGRWLFTMELVEGVDFLTWVRPRSRDGTVDLPTATMPSASGTNPRPIPAIPQLAEHAPPPRPRFEEARLRASMVQLVRGLEFLHNSGKVHRDIKPSNVLVTPTGRVVILDFGLVIDVERPEHVTEVHQVVGTTEYMAPEQASGGAISPAADWYGVGVVLFQALTGRLPFVGSRIDVMVDKQTAEAAAPRTVVPWVPTDLDALCTTLLSRNPAKRPGGSEIRRMLGPSADTPPVVSVPVPPTPSTASQLFIGRERELGELRQAFEATRKGAAITAYIIGESGVGKSALARRFTEEITQERGAVVLTGRCYERESVPYKAVDGIIDALARYMSKLPREQSAGLLPLRAALLPQIFPVLRQVDVLADAPAPLGEPVDPKELRVLGFAALRELLSRLGHFRPLVLLIDDLQWTDADSLALLRELLRPLDPPPLLLCATVRVGADGTVGKSSALELATSLPGDVRPISLHRLPEDDARALVSHLLAHAGATGDAELIAREAEGHPLFIDELVRHAAAGQSHPIVALEDALWSRIEKLEPAQREIVVLTAVAGAPVAEEVAAKATAQSFSDFSRQMILLRAANLVRTSGARRTDTVEPYHDRVRAAVAAHLSAEVRRGWHAKLAFALEATNDYEALATHWHAAGRADRAAGYALRAAEHAMQILAFERAARLFDRALEVGLPAGTHRVDILTRLGEAWCNAGRGSEAAQAYVEAAKLAPDRALELRRRAGTELLKSGRIDEGLAVLQDVLGAVGMKLARSPKHAIPSLLFRRAQLRLRGVGFRERTESEVPPALLQRVDVCYSLTAGLYVDPFRGTHFQTRHLLLALRAGEPYRVARALTSEVVYSATRGLRFEKRTSQLLEQARRIADRVQNPHAMAMVHGAAGMAGFLEGRWRRSVDECRKSEQLLVERCTGVEWELAGVRIFRMRSQFYLGEIKDLLTTLPVMRHEARELGDLYAATQSSSGFLTIDWLANDDVAGARGGAAMAIAQWSQRGTHITHYTDLLARVQISLYSGAYHTAYEQVLERWKPFSDAMLLRVYLIRTQLHELRARAALAAASEARGAERGRLLDDAARCARALRHGRTAWAESLSLLVSGCIAAARGDAERARSQLEESIRLCEAADMPLHAAAARLRLGELIGGDQGRALIARAREWMQSQSIRNPDRMAAMLAPRG
jgi:serine/threonine protein kinase